MAAEMVMVKRTPLNLFEQGLFIDSEVFADEFASIKNRTALEVTAVQPRSINQLRLAWALARVLAESGVLGDCDKQDAMDYLKMKAKHVRYVTTELRDGTTETVVIPKSIRFAAMDQAAFSRLLDRMIFVICRDILPQISENDLRKKVEEMAGISAAPPSQQSVPQSDVPPTEAEPAAHAAVAPRARRRR